MNLKDQILIRHLDRRTGVVSEQSLCGVLCTVTDAIEIDGSGFRKNGQIIVRILGKEAIPIICGDEICREGSQCWFTVTQVCDNRKQESPLSHWKVIGRR